MTDFRMPSLGADMEEGTVLEWLVKPGDTVHKGDIVAVVDTAKAAVEVETFTGGVVEELLVEVGTKVPVGTPLARITAEAAISTAAPPLPVAVPVVVPDAVPAGRPAARVPTPAPMVRRLAADLGVDLAEVSGTGLHGRITRDDVLRAAPPAAPAAPTGQVGLVAATPYARRLAGELGVDLAAVTPGVAGGPIRADDVRHAANGPATAVPSGAAGASSGLDEQARTGEPFATAVAPLAEKASATPAGATGRGVAQDAMRRAIGRLMARSKREIPHYYLSTTVDMSRAQTWMQQRNRDVPIAERMVPAALLLKATAVAARDHPQLNGFWVDDAFVPGEGVHLGVAISLRGGGLVAPAVHDADGLPLDELMAAVRDLVARARTGRLRGREMTDPTLTVTNLGDQGVESVLGVIYPPQVALVGFGKVAERPWATEGMLGVRPVTRLTLAADHRATDGFVGGRFLSTIDQLLQTPEAL
jgi:pyruvate dehydrogenase E2 component (dihydrolipoamide acetyltransferase)